MKQPVEWPSEPTAPCHLVCPHCGHTGHDARPHEVFERPRARRGEPWPVDVSRAAFRCGDCGEISPVWVHRRGVRVTSHLRDKRTGEPRMPPNREVTYLD